MRITKPITFAERQQIEQLLKQNFSVYKISAILKRAQTTIRAEIVRNGGVKVYNALLADAQHGTHRKEINLRNQVSQLEEKILILEQHIEIILDILKEKND